MSRVLSSSGKTISHGSLPSGLLGQYSLWRLHESIRRFWFLESFIWTRVTFPPFKGERTVFNILHISLKTKLIFLPRFYSPPFRYFIQFKLLSKTSSTFNLFLDCLRYQSENSYGLYQNYKRWFTISPSMTSQKQFSVIGAWFIGLVYALIYLSTERLTFF